MSETFWPSFVFWSLILTLGRPGLGWAGLGWGWAGLGGAWGVLGDGLRCKSLEFMHLKPALLRGPCRPMFELSRVLLAALRRAELNDWIGQQQQAISIYFFLEGLGFRAYSFGFRAVRNVSRFPEMAGPTSQNPPNKKTANYSTPCRKR